jgi:hypothetical protein
MRKRFIACMLLVAAIGAACSGAQVNQGLDTAIAVEQCVAPIVLDVTGVATEDVVQIVANCKVAAVDVYNYVSSLLASAETISDAGPDGALVGALMMPPRAGAHYYTAAQISKLRRIQKTAAVLAGIDGGTP